MSANPESLERFKREVEWLVDTGAPVQTWLASLPLTAREQAVAEIHAALHPYYDGESVNVPIDVIVASGSKSM